MSRAANSDMNFSSEILGLVIYTFIQIIICNILWCLLPLLIAWIHYDVRGWLVNKLSCCLCLCMLGNVDFCWSFHTRPLSCQINRLCHCPSTICIFYPQSGPHTQDLLYSEPHVTWQHNVKSADGKKSKCWTWNENRIVTQSTKYGRYPMRITT